MAQNRSRFVLLCQQTLAFGVVLAIAAPAANLVTLDIVAPPRPRTEARAQPTGGAAGTVSVVASRPVRPQVTRVPLRGVSKAGLRALGGRGVAAARLTSASTGRSAGGSGADRLTALSAPQPVHGLATVGVTWAHGVQVPDRAITISVRTQRSGTWSAWTGVPYHEDEGPDPTSAEGGAAEPGTDPVYVGAVDDVQVKALTDTGTAPAGMKLSLVDPGRQVAARAEQPAIDTGRLSLSATTSTEASRAAARVTAKPRIFSRAQWGADERMRERSALHYGEVHGGFVHHTVNANGYTAAQVPAIIRGIYAYHTQSRGWSDIGYNFLVDRFGRIWEGRYGGVTRPVVGAHTLGYNDDAFAMSAIGNYDIAQPSSAMVDAFGRLFAWKLSLHGVFASSRRQWITRRYLPAIDGHRDVGQTACPGRYLYAQIPTIRARAARYQRSFAPRVRTTRVAGSSRPVIVARDRRTRQVWLVSTRPDGTAGRIRNTGTRFPHANLVLNAGDWDGDGRGDLITRSARSGLLHLYRGVAGGHLRAPVLMSRTSFGRDRLLAAVGDMTGDGRPDLMGQPVGGAMRIFPGNGATGFHGGYVAHSAISAISQLGVGFYNGDGSPDSVLRRSDGTLVLYPGNGPGGLTGGTRIGSAGRNYDWVVSVGDITGDRRPDLVARAAVTHRMWLLPGSRDGYVSRRSFRTGMGRFDLFG
jgi:hypothetical protein